MRRDRPVLRIPHITYDLKTLREDIFGGVTVAVVGLPLALAFGVSSGLGPLAGIYGAISVGFFAAVFGGTKSLISGPTGPTTVVMAAVVTTHAQDVGHAFTIVIMAGVIQILLGVLRIGRMVAFTPYSVISGFMSGIGLIIILIQVLPFLGAESAAGGPLGAIRAIPDAMAGVNYDALIIAATTLAVGALWPGKLRKWLPSAVAALTAGTLLGVLLLTGSPSIGDVPSGLPEIRLPDVPLSFLVEAVTPALTIALLGSIDSLITSLIADSMTRKRHDPNRELVSQGIGNTIAGFIWGLPGAGNTLVTVVNIRAGGRTLVAGALSALILMALALGLGKYVESIPLAVLAGILIKVGWDIIDWRFILRAHRVHREHLAVMLITLALTVFLDLVTAVAIGLIAAGMASARQFERLEMDRVVSTPLLDRTFLRRDAPESVDDFSARVGMVSLQGTFTVASSNRLVNSIGADIHDHEVLIFDFRETAYMDDSAALVVEQLIELEEEEGTPCIIMGLHGATAATLHSLNVLGKVPDEHYVPGLESARELVIRILDEDQPGPAPGI